MTIANATPFTLTNGTTADATQVQANFDQLIANVNANAAANGANSDITSLTGLTTPLGRTYGGSQFYIGGTSTGAADAQVVATLVPTTGFSLYAGVMVAFIAGFNNTAATTLNVFGSGAKNVFRQISTGAAACVGGEIKAGQLVLVVYDGTQFQLLTDGYLSTPLLRSLGALTVVAGNILYGSGAAAVSVLAPGTSGQFLTSGGAGAPTWTTPNTFSTQAEMETGTSTTTMVSPGRQHFHPGHPKAWANFEQSGTHSGNGYNVSSYTDNGTGLTEIAWTTAFSAATYGVTGWARATGIPSVLILTAKSSGTYTTAAIEVAVSDVNQIDRDTTQAAISAFGDI